MASADTLEREMNRGKRDAQYLKTSILTTIARDQALSTKYMNELKGKSFADMVVTGEMAYSVSKKHTEVLTNTLSRICQAQQVSLCFLLDTTGSMSTHITGVKDQINDMVNYIVATNTIIHSIAFVGYKDWCDGDDHYEILDFTTDLVKFRNFLSAITATGGGDTPEDVLGGLNRAVQLKWPNNSGTRIIFHIADAPPHGNPTYHTFDDDYPRGHSKDPSIRTLFKLMQIKNIAYYFGKMNGHCDKMIEVFNTVSNECITTYDTKQVNKITECVVESVMRSVSMTSSLAMIDTTSKLNVRPYTLVESIPNWKDIKVQTCSFLTYDPPKSIHDIITFKKFKENIKSPRNIKIAQNPFAHGSVRLAYYGQKIYKKKGTDVIFKEMKVICDHPELDRLRYLDDLKTTVIAQFIATQFNQDIKNVLGDNQIHIIYLNTKVVKIVSSDKSIRYYSMENKYYDGDMIKWTNNWNFVRKTKYGSSTYEIDELSELSVAYSHYSYHITNGVLLICDIQGIYCQTDGDNGMKINTLLMTDPAIHCEENMSFGSTNLGKEGLKTFKQHHVCNRFCHALNLPIFTTAVSSSPSSFSSSMKSSTVCSVVGVRPVQDTKTSTTRLSSISEYKISSSSSPTTHVSASAPAATAVPSTVASASRELPYEKHTGRSFSSSSSSSEYSPRYKSPSTDVATCGCNIM